MLTFQDQDQPVELKPQRVLLNGRDIGEVKPRKDHRDGSIAWHAVIQIDDPYNYLTWFSGMAQGHGPTKERAVRNALAESRLCAEFYQTQVRQIEKELLGSTPGDDTPAAPDAYTPGPAADTVTLL